MLTNLSPKFLAHAQELTQEFADSSNGMTAVVIATTDGFEVTSVLVGKSDAVARLAAMASSLSAIADVMLQELDYTGYQSLLLNADDGFVGMVPFKAMCAQPEGGEEKAKIDLICTFAATSDAVAGQAVYKAKQIVNTIANARY